MLQDSAGLAGAGGEIQLQEDLPGRNIGLAKSQVKIVYLRCITGAAV